MNLWERYNPEQSLGGVLGEALGMPLNGYSEKKLFEALKRHFTRKELRSWVLAQSGESPEAIAEAMETGIDEVDTMLRKATKKVRQPKLRQAILALLPEEEEA